MGQTTIGWCSTLLPDGTWLPGYTHNVTWGCTKVSAECDNCYAETLSTRYGFSVWGAQGERRTFGEKYWNAPRKWNKEAAKSGIRRKVFCSSMSDVFENHPVVRQEAEKLWPLIEETPWLDWLLLTKRPGNILKDVPQAWLSGFPQNVWIGTSIGQQKYAERRMNEIMLVPARVHFISVEPQLEHVWLKPWLAKYPEMRWWIVCGGESGTDHRPFSLDWARSLRDQCLETQTPFFFKQVGGQHHASGGRLLDGRTWDEFPHI